MCSKEPRKLPPHQAEVEAIQQDSIQIFFKIHFPNDTNAVRHVKLLACLLFAFIGLWVCLYFSLMSVFHILYF